ncbi:hypothetical protein BU17DRAFT_89991 [Hysterangium stoloniferum]|nr:hypothetical protein BU17DRAFT_89991 [Hysterangium stoloniferum]
MANPKSQIKWCNKLDTLLKQALPVMSNAGMNQTISFIWTFIINLVKAVVGWVQASLMQSVQITSANIAQSKLASVPIKCMKCSTKGHQALACQSKNPVAVRRWIAANQKKRMHVTPLPDYSALIAQPYPLPPSPLSTLPLLQMLPSYVQWQQAQSRRDCSCAKKKGLFTSAPVASTSSLRSKPKK